MRTRGSIGCDSLGIGNVEAASSRFTQQNKRGWKPRLLFQNGIFMPETSTLGRAPFLDLILLRLELGQFLFGPSHLGLSSASERKQLPLPAQIRFCRLQLCLVAARRRG